MKKTIILLAIGLSTVGLAACGSGSESNSISGDSTTGVVWQWQSVTNQTTSESTSVPDPDVYTIEFNEDGTFEGQADCNAFSGTYSTESGFSITLGPSTLAFCGEASLDTMYLDLLSN
ncbi:MAG: META domain-containing protein, partial [Candidatus Promineifilaceae bacterium]|nr:META domain-containing protein [Candidatus Promineifilaceae bacterium]